MASPTNITLFFDTINSLVVTLKNISLLNRRYLDNDVESDNVFKNVITRLQVIQQNASALDDNRLFDFTNNLKTIENDILNIAGKEFNIVSESVFSQVYSKVRNIYRYTNYIWDILFKVNDNDTLRSEIEALKAKTEQDARSISELRNRMEIELNEFEERYRDNLGNYELLAQEKIFREESDNTISRWIWMLIIGLISIVLIIMCFQFMEGCWIDIDCLVNKKDKLISIGAKKSEVLFYYELFKPTVLRFFIISILIMLLKFAISNYNAIMHNRVVNLHKANSLAAMLRVINSLTDENTRNTLINLAGKEIFLHQKTGYLRKDDNKIDLGIIEKLASILQKKE